MKNTHSNRSAFRAVCFIIMLINGAQTVCANDQLPLEEIVVSDFRPTVAAKQSTSIMVLNAKLIEDTNAQHFQELTELVPNLNWAGGVSRPRYFQIRGIGERSQYEGAPNASVGFIVDDLDFSGLGSIATLFDVEQIEVLRGPQGTRFGANALAGLIYVKTRQPTDQFDANIKFNVGSDDARSVGAAFGGPVTEALSYRAVLQQHNSNGFRYNAFSRRDDTNQRDELSTRLKLRYLAGDNWRGDLTFMHVDINNGYDAFAVDNGFTTYSDRPGQDAQRSSGVVLDIQGAISDTVSFQSISGIARSDVIFSFDADWGNENLWAPITYDFFSHTERDRQTLSQELRFISTPGAGISDGRVDWVAGVAVAKNQESNITQDDGNYEGFLDFSSITREFEARNMAIFGDVNYAYTDRLSFNAGIRFESRDARYNDTVGDRFSPDESSVGGQISLSFSLRDQSLLYGKVARGYKAGGFNLGLPAQAQNDTLLFDAEYLWNYELGVNGQFQDQRLKLNANVFWMQRRDQQVQTSAQLDPNNPTTFLFFTDNAGNGKNRGAEVSADYWLTDTLSLYANIGLLDTEIRNFNNGSGQDGRDQAHAPNYSYALGARVDFSGHWFARLDVSGKDGFYFSDSHDQKSKAYSLVNARFGIERKNWSLVAWGRNLFDQQYAVRGFFFGNEPARDFVDTLYTRQGDPRTIGLSYEFRYSP